MNIKPGNLVRFSHTKRFILFAEKSKNAIAYSDNVDILMFLGKETKHDKNWGSCSHIKFLYREKVIFIIINEEDLPETFLRLA